MMLSRLRQAVLIAAACLPLTWPVARAQHEAPRKKLRVSPHVLAKMVQKEAAPVYPEAALEHRVRGQVMVHVLVGPDGRVTEAESVRGDPALGQAAVDAARKFQFQPCRLGGEAISVDSQMVFVFSIKGHGNKVRGQAKYVRNPLLP